MKNIKFFLLTFLFAVFFISCKINHSDIIPGNEWKKATNPEEYGYSTKKLEEAKKFSQGLKTSAVVIIVNGVILNEWGEVEKKYYTHSARKSFLSALYGLYVSKGIIDLNKNMKDLNIDDVPPLMEQEKEATIKDCLMARSGVYHTAEAETEGMHNLKPKPGTYKHGEYWLYNNWDFNVLGTIFHKLTGKTVFQSLKEDLADPIHMEHFNFEDTIQILTGRSIHAAYMFIISARDMARFGLLMLRKGSWNGKQIIPKDWVEESTKYYSDASVYRSDGYGYMWWTAKDGNQFPHFPNVTLKEGTYSARGAGGHYIVIIPEHDMVFVHRVDTFIEGNNVSAADFGTLLNMVLSAKIK